MNFSFRGEYSAGVRENLLFLKSTLLIFIRIHEITEWRNVIEDRVRNINVEREHLLKEKDICEKQKNSLHFRFTLINECNTLRCSRRKEDMCTDPVDEELRNVIRTFIKLYGWYSTYVKKKTTKCLTVPCRNVPYCTKSKTSSQRLVAKLLTAPQNC
jgi:hypothetical protein